jgi:D-alanine-D-alanine ligase
LEQPVPKSEFLSFSEKYLDQGGSMKGAKSKVRIPAPLSTEKSKEIQELALKVFRILGCSGTARIDFLLDAGDKDKVYVNEINPLPGSLQQHLWKASGIDPVELVVKLIELAEERASDKKSITYTFESNVLSGSGLKGIKNL